MSAADKIKLDNTVSCSVTSVADKTGAVTLSKSDVGLNNVDNTSDLNKPISNDTQTALNLKLDSSAFADKSALIAGSINKVLTADSATALVSPDYVYNSLNAEGNPISCTFSNNVVVNFFYRTDGQLDYYLTPTHKVQFNYNSDNKFIGKTTTQR